MGPIELALVAGTPAATMLAKDLLFKILGPSAEYLGEKLKGNLVAVAGKAQTMMQEAGIEPAQVHPRIGVPLLESARLEDDEDMQERWAALLANSANPESDVSDQPKFVELLRQLDLFEAKVLEAFYSDEELYINPLTVQEITGIESPVRAELIIENLSRLGLVNKRLIETTDGIRVQDHLATRNLLGKEFVAACRRPKRRPGERG